MKEIPILYIRANQTGIVALAILAILTQQPLMIGLLLIIESVGLLFGLKANLFVRLAKPFLKVKDKGQTEARELARFNNSLAVIFLSLSSLFFVLGWPVAGFITVGVLGFVAFVAICGFCLGCFLYYQFKMLKFRKPTILQ